MAEATVNPMRRLWTYAWRVPVLSIPFAIFFGTMLGASARNYVDSYKVSLIFSGVSSLGLWLVESYLAPAVRSRLRTKPGPLTEGLLYMTTSIAGVFLAALVVRATILPGFLGGGREIAVFGMFSLMFAGLFTAVVLVFEYHKSSIDHARSDKELELARTIQRSFLPESFPTSARIEVHAMNVPSRRVSGDFYDVVPTDDGLILAIADVEGKSIPAALLVAALQASLRTQTASTAAVSAIVANINTLVCQRVGIQQFATFFLARVENDGRRLRYCCAGHNPPILFRANGARQLLDRGGMMFGVLEAAPFEEEVIELQAGDRAVFYTDGITETTSPSGEEFGPDRLAAIVASLPPQLPARLITERIVRETLTFSAGADPADDQTLLVLRVSG